MSETTSNPTSDLDLDGEMSRRGAFKLVAAGVTLMYVGAIGYPVFRYLNSSVEKSETMAAIKEVTLDKANSLAKGTALIFKFGVRPALLIHHKNDTWVALDAVCTHMGCTVKFDEAQEKIICACHGGQYNAETGENISGPPPRPLTKYEVAVNETSVTVKRA